jgi:hypothetical protein
MSRFFRYQVRPLLLTAAVVALAAVSGPAQAVESYMAGESGWVADSAGTGLVALRGSLRVSRDTASTPGTVLAFCSSSDARILFDPGPTGGIRSSEPSGRGTAALTHRGPDGEPRSRLSSLKVFANGSFELSDLSVGAGGVAGALLSEVAEGVDQVVLKLNPVPAEARFEQARQVVVRFKLGQQDRAELARFQTGCRLLQRAS